MFKILSVNAQQTQLVLFQFHHKTHGKGFRDLQGKCIVKSKYAFVILNSQSNVTLIKNILSYTFTVYIYIYIYIVE